MSIRRTYETTLIVNAALEDPDVEALISKVTGYVENHGGEILLIDKWGRKRLAYPINKKFNGFYVRIEFEAAPSTIPILERFMVLEDTILRHLTLLLPQILRDFRKKKALEKAEREKTEGKDSDDKRDGKRRDRRDDFRRGPGRGRPVRSDRKQNSEKSENTEKSEKDKTETAEKTED